MLPRLILLILLALGWALPSVGPVGAHEMAQHMDCPACPEHAMDHHAGAVPATSSDCPHSLTCAVVAFPLTMMDLTQVSASSGLSKHFHSPAWASQAPEADPPPPRS